MKFKSTGWAIVMVFLGLNNLVQAQGTAFMYQGRLNAGGAPANGNYDLRFAIFNAATNGNLLGGPVTNSAVNVTNGLFTTLVDFGNVFNGTSNWLELAVSPNGANAFTALAPRQPVTPVPTALYAGSASNLLGTVNASQLTGNIPATSLSGTIALAQLPAGVLTNGATGVNITGTFTGNGAGMTNLSASNIGSGTLPVSQLPASVVTNGAGSYQQNNLSGQSYSYGWPDYTQWPDGWNSWFAVGAGLNESRVTNAINSMASVWRQFGFTTISLDASIFTNADTNGIPMMDPANFPHGFPWLCQYAAANGFKIGVYGSWTNDGGYTGGVPSFWFYGHETNAAAYFLTNGVTYYKFDSPLTIGSSSMGSYFPSEYDPYGHTPVAPMQNSADQSYYTFVTALRSSRTPVFVNASSWVDANGNLSPNTKFLLNSFRATQQVATNAAGIIYGGDMNGAKSPLIRWLWFDTFISVASKFGGWFYPDMDSLNPSIIGSVESHIYSEAFLGSIFQLGSSQGNYASYHEFATNFFSSGLLRQIRSRQTTPKFCYVTNGCYVFSKPNNSGGLDVLVQNRNYITTFNIGDGSSLGEVAPGRMCKDYWGVFQYTNYSSQPFTFYALTFFATNVTLDFGRLGMTSTNVIITEPDFCGATLYASGSFSDFVKADGARLYTINPVVSFPVSSAASVDMTTINYFNEWVTNSFGVEPIIGAFNGNSPVFNGVSVKGLQVGDATRIDYGVNGASTFSCYAGIDSYGHGVGSQFNILTNGFIAYSSPVWNSGFTNLIVNVSGATTVSIQASNRCFFGNPQLNYANYLISSSQLPSTVVTNNSAQVNLAGTMSGTFTGDGSGLTSLNVTNLSGTLQAANFQATTATNFSASGALPASFAFPSHGGRLIFTTSGSGSTGSAPASIGMTVGLDSAVIATNRAYLNANGRGLFIPQTLVKPNVPAGNHTVTLSAWNGITTDTNDYFYVTVQELPY